MPAQTLRLVVARENFTEKIQVGLPGTVVLGESILLLFTLH